MININEIKKIIPHRYPFLLIDRVLELNLGKSILGTKNVSANEPHFNGHFPHSPIMPGVLTVESMAQLSTILVSKTINANKEESEAYLLSIENAKFRKMIVPGDVVHIYVEIENKKNDIWKFKANSKVDGIVACEATFMAIVKKAMARI